MPPAALADGPPAKASKTDASARREAFLDVFRGLKQDVMAHPMLSQSDAREWMARMLEYNVPGGKLNRGMSVRDTLLTIKPDASDAEQLRADQTGWAIEFLQVRLRDTLTLWCARQQWLTAPRTTRHVLGGRSRGRSVAARRRTFSWRMTSWTRV